MSLPLPHLSVHPALQRQMSRLPGRLYADLVGKPFLPDGRGPEGYDCLGLAIELQRRQGRDVPDYASTSQEFARQYSEGLLGPCRQIVRPEAGCVVLMRMLCDERHIGTMIDPWSMFHTMEGNSGGASIERVHGNLSWSRRVLGYYVPEATA